MASGSCTAANLFLLRRQSCTELILAAKKAANKSWEQIGKELQRSPVWVASCILGENSMDEDSAQKLIDCLQITDQTTKTLLMEPPLKAQTPANVLLQDPCIYRLHEATLVYGLALKEVIQEKFGDGIMSAIDFTVDVEEDTDEHQRKIEPARVKIVMSGKFLPYKRW